MRSPWSDGLVEVARAFVSPAAGTVVNVAAVISGLGAQLACANGAARLLFALGRDRVGPRWLARTHPAHRSPVGALLVVAVVTLAAVLPFAASTPLDAFFYLATYGADLIIAVYLLTVVAAFLWSRRPRRRNPAHLATLLLGIVAIGYILKSTVYPVPEYPFNYCMYAAGITLALGVAALVVAPGLRRALRRSPLFAVDAADAGGR